MAREHDFLAALQRVLPIEAPCGTLSLVEHGPVTMIHGACHAHFAWRTREAIEQGWPAAETYVTLGSPKKGGFAMDPLKVEALLRALAAVLAKVSPEDAAQRFEYPTAATWLPKRALESKTAHTQADYERLLIDSLGVQELFLSPEARAALLSAEQLEALLRERFPARGGEIEMTLAFNNPVAMRSGALVVTFDVIAYETDARTGVRSVTDIKEQEIYFVPSEHRADPERVREFVFGLADGLELLFAQKSADDSVRYAMPYDLVDASLLALKKARTRADFFQAFCRRRKLAPPG